MKTVEIRDLFLKYFEDNDHVIVESAPLVPINDPSLLWISAGVVPMKKYFDGSTIPQSKRMVNSQRCLRTNDIENVGFTARHHTYFEMLGNFSIGDYFKKEAIAYAYDFLTSKKWLGLDKDKLYMTYYPEDLESKKIWESLGVEESHLVPLSGNFWEIGEGPCGPCTEIFYDRGEEFDSRGVELLFDDLENDRYIEIWNVVLSQFNSKDELDRKDYPELPNKNIDTGMGLERIACIMQNAQTNFEIDIFKVIIDEIAKLANISYSGQSEFKVIADHVRTLCLAISDSALPSNEGRGYVLRRILRRAVKYGVKLGFDKPFMYKLVKTVNQSLPFYDFSDRVEMIETIIKNEEEKFYKTLVAGEKKLAEFTQNGSISGEEAFLLYDTFGFPIELTVEIASEAGIDVNIDEFNKYLDAQKERSRASRNEDSGLLTQSETLLNLKLESSFVGYDKLQTASNIIGILKDDELVDSATGKMGLILDTTPFYAESGGQVSDRGVINDYEVLSVVKAPRGQHLHFIDTEDTVSLSSCNCIVDESFRNDVTLNHSATHLLNYALKQHFGEQIKQQGSYVTNNYLRFDFTHFETVSDSDIVEVEKLVNEYIKNWQNVEIEEMPIEEAKAKGAAALFGEKYGDVVRVVRLGESLELCGGCHVGDISSINLFAIASYESKGSGVYRVVATTSKHVTSQLSDSFASIIDANEDLLSKIIETRKEFDDIESSESINLSVEKFNALKTNLHSYSDRVSLNEIKNDFSNYKKQLDKAIKESQLNTDIDTSSYVENINGRNVAVFKLEGVSSDVAKATVDKTLDNYDLDLVVVCAVSEKVVFIAKASDAAVSSGINCGEIVKTAAIICEGNGGGRPNFASAGGKNSQKVDEAIKKVKELI